MALAITQQPNTIRISIRRGSTFALTGQYLVDDAAQSITGWIFRMTVRGVVTSSTAIVTWSTTTGHIVIDEGAKTWTLHVPASETALLSPMLDGFYDFEQEDPDGYVRCPFSGPFDVLNESTR